MSRLDKSSYYILSVNINTKQLYLQLQKLLTDNGLCHGSNLHTFIHKFMDLISIHLYGPLQKKMHILIYQDIFTYIPGVYRRYIFYMGNYCLLCLKEKYFMINYPHGEILLNIR